jgi:hypothetical protein
VALGGVAMCQIFVELLAARSPAFQKQQGLEPEPVLDNDEAALVLVEESMHSNPIIRRTRKTFTQQASKSLARQKFNNSKRTLRFTPEIIARKMTTTKLGFVPLSPNILAPPSNLCSFKFNVENIQYLSPESKDLRFKKAQSELGKYGSSRSEYLDPDLTGYETQRGSKAKEKSTE